MKRFFLIACLLIPTSYAQALPTPVDPTTGLPIKDPGPRFEIHFPGGTPKELLKEIEKAAPGNERPNVVIHPECVDTPIPPFTLRDVTASQVFTALNSLVEPNFKDGIWRQVPLQDAVIWTLSKPQPPAPVDAPPPARRMCRVFNLSPFLETFTVEDVTTAIQGTWDLMKANDNRSIKYHKDTKLLIVVGEGEHIMAVSEVLRELEKSVTPKQVSTKSESKEAAKKP